MVSFLTIALLVACGGGLRLAQAQGDATSIRPAELAQRLLDDPAPLILDVRTAGEYTDGHIPGAVNIPHTELWKRVDELEPNRNQEIVVHCQRGPRAAVAFDILQEAGFTRLTLLDGPMQEWLAEQLPLEHWAMDHRSKDNRPPVWVGHITLTTHLFDESERFMRQIGMRSIGKFEDTAILELRGGTHLVLLRSDEPAAGQAGFDLMVEDLSATHAEFRKLGLHPGEIEHGTIHDRFEVIEPGGSRITFNSTHVSEFAV